MSKLKVASKDIFPLIKKFLYNDQDIFLRELVSNAVDATQKLITLSNKSEYTGPINKEVIVKMDLQNNYLQIIDNGIGMTKAEVEKYICQIAFSGAEEFINNYNDADIIGHFGMGFYSAFMVADKVDIISQSYDLSQQTVFWQCEGDINYTLKEVDDEFQMLTGNQKHPGTEITLYISESYKEYFTVSHIKSLLNRYNKFIKVPVKFIEVVPDEVDSSTGELVVKDNIETVITSENAIWTKSPSSLTDEDYINFYHELYPTKPDPVFWLHLNIDHPFTFTGVLYFPAYDITKPLFEKNNLHLYCNQVFVTDNMEGILPEYMRLLHGIIDSPDIPLNMSRSEAQSDTNVKKIKTYISSKVMSALKKIIKNDRAEYEKKWNTIKSFINLGIIMEDDVWDKAKDIVLLTDLQGNHYTFDEYYDKVKDTQVSKNDTVVYLYATNKDAQYSYIRDAQRKGYNVLLMDTPYNAFEAQTFEIECNKANKDVEGKLKIRFQRVDSDVIDKLICKEEVKSDIPENVKNMLITLFTACTPTVKGYTFRFTAEALNDTGDINPISIVTDEALRRIKEMQILNNSGVYISRDTILTFVLNTNCGVIKYVLSEAEKAIGKEIEDINIKIKELQGKQKEDDLSDDRKKELEDEFTKVTDEKNQVITEYAQRNSAINDLIDLALLQYGLLTGDSLYKFIKNSFRHIIK